MSIPERTNHQLVHFVLAFMNQELVLVDHCLAVATILPWETVMTRLSGALCFKRDCPIMLDQHSE